MHFHVVLAPCRQASRTAAMPAEKNMPAQIRLKAALAGMPTAIPMGPAAELPCEERMRHKLINQDQEKTWVVVFETGEEVVSRLQRFCEEQNLSAARFSAIGAFSAATLGYFEWNRKEYEEISVNEQVEVLSMLGDVAEYEGAPKLHVHVVLGKRDGSAWGGHLLEAYVRPTLEVVLTEAPAHLRRCMDSESRLPLINPDA